jgi:anti-sigma regulatory factor (Ser/Thr protein kinase)
MRSNTLKARDFDIERDFYSDLENVAAVTEEITDFCRSQLRAGGSHDDICSSITLCLAEAMTNVVRHAYRNKCGLPIRIQVKALLDRFEFLLADQGAAMPEEVMTRRLPNFDADELDSLPVGGFGWGLIFSEMDEVHYYREAGVNHLSLVKRF